MLLQDGGAVNVVVRGPRSRSAVGVAILLSPLWSTLCLSRDGNSRMYPIAKETCRKML